MNEARNKKQNAWKKGLTAVAITTIIGLSGFSVQQNGELKETTSHLEEKTKELNKTKDKVEEQNDFIKELDKRLAQQDATIGELTIKLDESARIQKEQEAKINQLDADLKKKRASRAKSSAVSANVNGMTLFRSTAYSYGTKTASGTHVQEGRTIAVDPRVIPLGSQVRIVCPSYPSVNGVYTAEDTGAVIKGNIVDIYISGQSRALDFGRRDIYVQVLN